MADGRTIEEIAETINDLLTYVVNEASLIAAVEK